MNGWPVHVRCTNTMLLFPAAFLLVVVLMRSLQGASTPADMKTKLAGWRKDLNNDKAFTLFYNWYAFCLCGFPQSVF